MTHFIDVSGSPYEQGRLQGGAARREIEDNLAFIERGRAELAAMGRRFDYDRLIAANEAFVEKESPGTLEEIAGIAEGAGVSYRDILLLNLPLYQVGSFMPMECTQILLAPPQTGDGYTYLAKVRDLRGDDAFHQTVLRRTLSSGDWVVEANVAGCVTWPGIGVNSHGFAMSTSGAWSRRTEIDWGRVRSSWLLLNVGVLLRESRSTAEFAENLARHPRLTPVICTAVDRESASIYEVTAGEVHVLPVTMGVGVRTNHTHTPALAASAPTREEYPSTYHRYEKAVREIQRQAATWTLASLAALLSDHDGFPQSSICRHRERLDDARTLYASIVRVDDGLSVTIMGNPCEKVPLNEPISAGPGVIVVQPPRLA
jgi:isopenicillin-N N-acyltransferase-like protein